MLKMFGKGKKDGKPVRLVVFGLSHGNLAELMKGRPIPIKGEDCGLEADVEILIFAGKDARTMAREMARFIGPETKLHIDPRLRD